MSALHRCSYCVCVLACVLIIMRMSGARVRQTKDNSIDERRRQRKQWKAFKTIPNFVLGRLCVFIYFFALALPMRFPFASSLPPQKKNIAQADGTAGAHSFALLWSFWHNRFRFRDGIRLQHTRTYTHASTTCEFTNNNKNDNNTPAITAICSTAFTHAHTTKASQQITQT